MSSPTPVTTTITSLKHCAAALEQFQAAIPAPQTLDLSPWLPAASVKVDLLRLDLIDPLLGGNKWFKLRPHLQQAIAQGQLRIASFGGAHSNHLHALAAAGQRFGLHTIGLVRGYHAAGSRLSPTLLDAQSMGMELHFLSRQQYAQRYEPGFLQQLQSEHQAYLIPEGGEDRCVLDSVAGMLAGLAQPYDVYAAACGTGTTLAGVITALSAVPAQSACGVGTVLAGKGLGVSSASPQPGVQPQVLGISALKDGGSIAQRVQALLGPDVDTVPWRVASGFHHGGFARLSPELVHFIDQFEAHTAVPLDPVYTAKLMFALVQLVADRQLASGMPGPLRILAVHSSGLQGRCAMEQKMANLRARPQ